MSLKKLQVDSRKNWGEVLLQQARENEQEFQTEVKSIGQTNHMNLVQLLGFCNEGEHWLLVYEFMSLQWFLGEVSLWKFRPYWHQRIQIAFGTARGLFYLQEECSTWIIHAL